MDPWEKAMSSLTTRTKPNVSSGKASKISFVCELSDTLGLRRMRAVCNASGHMRLIGQESHRNVSVMTCFSVNGWRANASNMIRKSDSRLCSERMSCKIANRSSDDSSGD